MASRHSIEDLRAGSRYIGRKCPTTRTELSEGEKIIVCHKSDEVFSWAALPDLEGRCPYCNQAIDLEEVINPSNEKTFHSKSKPQPRNGLMSALRALAVLGLIGICVIGGAIGYREFFAQSTTVPTTIPLIAQATDVSGVIASTSTSSAVEISSSANTPTLTLATETLEPSPTTYQRIAVHQYILLDTEANESTDFISPPIGQITLGGIPFQLSDSVFKSQASPAPHNNYPTSVLLSTDVPLAYQVHLLLNTGNGFNQFDGKVVGKVVAYCNGSSTVVANLQLGRDIREWHVADNVVSTASRPQQVWAGELVDFPSLTGHIDMLSVDLPEGCRNGKLTALEIIDSSIDTTGSLDPALNLIGITVDFIDSP